MTDTKQELERLMWKVHQMRDMQRKYFGGSGSKEFYLKESKRLEKEVDRTIATLANRGYELKEPPPDPEQKNLFK